MLTGLGIQLALGVERSTRAFQEKVGAFPSRQLTFWSEVSSHPFPAFPLKTVGLRPRFSGCQTGQK
jgi:hypothetical protein